MGHRVFTNGLESGRLAWNYSCDPSKTSGGQTIPECEASQQTINSDPSRWDKYSSHWPLAYH